MSRAVWKYEIPVDDEWHEVEMPSPARVLHVACQDGRRTSVSVWVEVTPDGTPVCIRNMRVFGTGQPISSGACYLGTAFGGPFVWHVYAEATA